MHVFETLLVLLVGAALLSILAKRAHLPYPALLALGGASVALVPGTPTLNIPPDLILALFVAPILLDAAHDTSLRDLRKNWRAISSLVLFAVALTTVAVAFVARHFFPDMPWAAAIALGALLAPPDAVAALAVLRHVSPPHRVRTILEGESLLNDASSLLIYKVAVAAVAVGSFSASTALPTFALTTVGSVVSGWVLAKIAGRLMAPLRDAPTATILQFATTFGVWILAERLGLSGVITIVVFGLTAGRRRTSSANSHVRFLTNSTWEAATFVLNVLAFTLIGLQLRPVIEAFPEGQRWRMVSVALMLLAVVVLVRLAWVSVYGFARHQVGKGPNDKKASLKGGLLVGWSGMRGIVSLAAALALPVGFPYRDFILLTAFTVVLGTLVIQGMTLRPLLGWLKLPPDTKLQDELSLARAAALEAAMAELERRTGPEVDRMRMEYRAALSDVRDGNDPQDSPDNALRQEVLPVARKAIDKLRDSGQIGDDAYRAVERELDLLELSSRTAPELQ
jgi:CPA1 family monovalent cation:H+ antiporter